MKYFTKTSIVLAFFAIVVLIACESKPTIPYSLSVKRWVLGQIVSDDSHSYLDWEDIFDEFDTKAYVKKYISQYDIPKSKYADLCKYCNTVFEYLFPCDMLNKSCMMTNLKKYLDEEVELNGLHESDRKIVEEICTKLIDEFDTFFSELTQRLITVLDCVPGEKSKSKSYRAYWVTYEFVSDFYILVYYTGFVHSDKITFEIKYQGQSLADLSTYLK